MINAQQKLIYIGDPMCSWCYGIAPEMDSVLNHYGDKIDFELLTGGLRAHGTERMSSLSEFLKHHWEDVAKASGQEFNYDILNQEDFIYNTEPACRSVVVIRHLSPDKEWAFFHKVQNAFYKENHDTGQAETFAEIAHQIGVDSSEFNAAFNSEKFSKLVEEDFRRARRLNVNSFPTLLLETNGVITPIAEGYMKSDLIIQRIDKILDTIARDPRNK